MSETLITVEQAATQLDLHPRTVLRYIRDGRLPATRIGKSYRIVRGALDAFAGVASGGPSAGSGTRATCVVDVPDTSANAAERLTGLLHSAALTGDSGTPPVHLQTAFDPATGTLKIVVIGSPLDVGRLLEMLHVQQRAWS